MDQKSLLVLAARNHMKQYVLELSFGRFVVNVSDPKSVVALVSLVMVVMVLGSTKIILGLPLTVLQYDFY